MWCDGGPPAPIAESPPDGVASGAMLGGVIFDLDGTLGDTLPVCFVAFRATFQRFLGVTYTDEEIRAMFGPTEEGMFLERTPDAVDDALAHYLEGYAANHHLCPEPFDGIVDLLDRLDEDGVPVAVVTGKGPHSTRISLHAWSLDGRFDRVEPGGDHGAVKPEKMAAVVGGWGVDPTTVVSIGDVPGDVVAGRLAGVVPVGAAWSPLADTAALDAAGPEALFDRVSDFAGWLARFG
jgi:phosphoglycolate phosphatase-like HAD superfamily hydrolase